MEHLEQDNRELKDEISRLTALMKFVIAAHNQPYPPPATPPPQRTVISEITSTFVHVATASQSTPAIPVLSASSPIVHTLPRVEEIIYHSEPYEGPDVYEKMDEMKDQFLKLHKELKTLRGKDLFGKSVAELCLVPNVKIPVKFKVPDFEKYKGNTCPLSHLVMYARNMSTQTDNDQLLIYYFQDSLTEAALRWYMGPNIASVELYPSLVVKNLMQPRNAPQIPEPLPWWFKPDLHCAFHQGAPCHDIENFYPLKYYVQDLVKSGMVSFKDRVPNVKANLLPAHGNASVNMVDGCHGNFRVFDVHRICRSLLEIHKDLCLVQQSRYMGNDVNVIVPVFKTLQRVVIQFDSNTKKENRSVSLLVTWLAGPIPYSSDKVVSYKYNATMVENGQEVPLLVADLVVSIVDVVKMTRSGRVFSPVFPKVVEDVSAGKKSEVPAVDPISAPTCQSSESSMLKANDYDEVLHLIKRSEFNIVEQPLQTPSKISVLLLLMNFEAHREALQRVLEQDDVKYDATVD
ncbi:hypothetical protein KIW84_035295 [Lathyrus oleraceus]|uniref:Uncharacterized protein n=1 Tax=Pisum sativum TaxID=3888 RepID=A0A9D5B0J6_PEA|nr:hypothetical protein KIW84_035295 [Pisum sativum]